MWTVKMLRGSKPPVIRQDEFKGRAWQRASDLQGLHSVPDSKVHIDDDAKLIIIDATEYYS